jgi:hypothetical protein
MTLAAILAVCLLSQAGSSQTAPAQSPAATQPAQDSATQPKPAPKPHHHKKSSTSNCPADAPATTSAGNSAASSTPCPPPKKVVRNGGSDEPPVQFSNGTPADQAQHERSTSQLTSATEENLKKISELQLNPSQQDIVSQIKQYIEQSKSAAADGDLDRAHNLAMKAHLLSEDLLKP